MTKYDHIVVGSGASGLTSALLLAQQGRRVLLLEKAPQIGGSLRRFRRRGVPFDTGFHFSGGLSHNGLLARMLTVLGMAGAVEPVFMDRERAHRFVFETENRAFELPQGIPEWRRKLREMFPAEGTAVEGYFDRVERVCAGTAGMDIAALGEPSRQMDEEFISLRTVLDGLTRDPLLKGIFCGLGMCYGVKPSEVSFATHSRICLGLHESAARLRNGGDALVEAFAARLRALHVEIRCGQWIAACRLGEDRCVERFVLSSGEEVAAASAVLTIHPEQILALLPQDAVSRAFASRVAAFEDAAGFFSVYGVVAPASQAPVRDDTIVSLFPTADFDRLLDPAHTGDQALVILGSQERMDGRPCRAVTVLEPSFPEHVAAWAESRTGARPAAYTAYKEARVASIRAHLVRHDAVFGEGFRVLDAASLLTFRDYLHSPHGSAYGIKQKLGQFNVIGRLPARNLFAAGQSALLPGVAGAMVSAFMVARSVVGKDAFGRFVREKLDA